MVEKIKNLGSNSNQSDHITIKSVAQPAKDQLSVTSSHPFDAPVSKLNGGHPTRTSGDIVVKTMQDRLLGDENLAKKNKPEAGIELKKPLQQNNIFEKRDAEGVRSYLPPGVTIKYIEKFY